MASHAIGCGTFSYLRLVERVVHRYSILHVLVMCGCSAGWRESQQREQEGEADKHIWSSFIGTTTSMRDSLVAQCAHAVRRAELAIVK